MGKNGIINARTIYQNIFFNFGFKESIQLLTESVSVISTLNNIPLSSKSGSVELYVPETLLFFYKTL